MNFFFIFVSKSRDSVPDPLHQLEGENGVERRKYFLDQGTFLGGSGRENSELVGIREKCSEFVLYIVRELFNM